MKIAIFGSAPPCFGHFRVSKPVLARRMRLLWAALLVLPVLEVRADLVFSSLHSFQFFANGEYPNGEYPQGGLVQGSDDNFYGTTEFPEIRTALALCSKSASVAR